MQQGTSLLEVLISLAILSTSMMATVALSLDSLQITRKALEQTQLLVCPNHIPKADGFSGRR